MAGAASLPPAPPGRAAGRLAPAPMHARSANSSRRPARGRPVGIDSGERGFYSDIVANAPRLARRAVGPALAADRSIGSGGHAMDRRLFLKTSGGAAAIVAAGGLARPALAQGAAARTVRLVPHAD